MFDWRGAVTDNTAAAAAAAAAATVVHLIHDHTLRCIAFSHAHACVHAFLLPVASCRGGGAGDRGYCLPPLNFSLSENSVIDGTFSSKNAKFWIKVPTGGEFRSKIEILSTSNVLYRINWQLFVGKLQLSELSAPATFMTHDAAVV